MDIDQLTETYQGMYPDESVKTQPWKKVVPTPVAEKPKETTKVRLQLEKGVYNSS
jgi:hypothetical protein